MVPPPSGAIYTSISRAEKKPFFERFFLDTESIVEATLLGPSLLGVDAAIVFADILSILEGFSVDYRFAPGPEVSYSPHEPLIFTKDPQETFSFLLEAIQQLTKRLTVPLIAFAASPLLSPVI